jgi:hypothetical protein
MCAEYPKPIVKISFLLSEKILFDVSSLATNAFGFI